MNDSFANSISPALNKNPTGSTALELKRLTELQKILRKNKLPYPSTILSYGCGERETITALRKIFPAATLVATDRDPLVLTAARDQQGEAKILFQTEEEIGAKTFDLVVCNGLFRRLQPLDRLPLLEFVREHIAEGGLFAFFELNPWNPFTKQTLKNALAERTSLPISPSKAIRLLESQGFQWILMQTLFYFPSWLSFLGWVEFFLGRFPLGRQYLVLCRVAPLPS